MHKPKQPFEVRKDFLVFGRPQIGDEEIDEVVATLRSGWIGIGPKVEEFEILFKKYIGAKHAVALESATAALFLSLIVAGIGQRDEVITTPLTFGATANAIVQTGAIPVFVDVDPNTFLIDPKKIESAITTRTRAIIPVHLHGRPCNMTEIMGIALKYNLVVIEDAAHCIEGIHNGHKIGTIGDFTCFSFHAGKNLTTSKGGMITTGRDDWAEKLYLYRDNGYSKNAWQRHLYGTSSQEEVLLPGYNYGMTDIAASLGIHQLKRLDSQLLKRDKIWRKYEQAFSNLPFGTPALIGEASVHSRHIYTLLLKKEAQAFSRDQIRQKLYALNVGTGIHYRSLHLHEYYKKLCKLTPEDLPVATDISERIFSIPLSASLSLEDVDYIITAVKNAFA